MDRICMSVAILPMAKEFGWAPGVQGIIQSSFLWGYMATQVLGGTLADKYGGKIVMAYGVLWFSLASLLLPVALSSSVAIAGLTLPAVCLARCCVGLGEGVALPCMNNLVARNIPPGKRATALGNAFTGFHSGNLLGLFVSPLLLAAYGWRTLFYTFGILGGPLLAVWLLVVPKQTRASRQDQAPVSRLADPTGGQVVLGEAAPVRPPPGAISMMGLMSKPATWAIIIVNFVNHWGYFIYLNWMPTYFYQVLGLDLKASSLLAFIPWLVMACGSTMAGWLADSLVRRGVDVTRVRKGMQTVAFLGPAISLLVLANRGISARLALTCMTCALGITSLGQAGFVANMSDIAPRYAGQMFGLCNTFGSLAGILGVSAVGFIVEKTGSFDPVFKLTAAMYVFATIVWNLLCTGERVFE
ncbi:hypothetical protein WJX72_001353 [[Myrmecia] bisecta]|uniref:Major facilitator superfamily (MFS) profile domain-containing protein n=1 Tax=[Myrmecia] bisecta TaxID=41462 RepID=A0AAW1R546_9CHLO